MIIPRTPVCALRGLAAAAILGGAVSLAAAEPQSAERTIRLNMNDAQVQFASKVYELQHASAEALLPFVNSAIQRYSINSTVRRVTSASGSDALLVSTGVEFMPYVDSIIAALDKPGTIVGTGDARVAYTPDYRAAMDFAALVDATSASSVGETYVNSETNTIFWKDQEAAAARTLDFVSSLDRPLPQARIRFNYYELRDSDLKDWGFDYLAWKNGPGVNLFNAGYNAGEMFINEVLDSVPYILDPSWSYGGFFTAPQFDMSFIRCLEQSGNSTSVANSSLVVVNTPVASETEFALLKEVQTKNSATAPFVYRTSMQPEYQNIAKNTLGRTFVGKSFYEDDKGNKYPDPPALEITVANPFICFGEAETDARGFIPSSKEFYKNRAEMESSGGVMFDYAFFFKSVVERGNTGAELSNSALVTGSATVGFGKEKILAVYDKSHDVEQTIGLPILCRIPVLKYLFSTVTTIQERTYIVVTAEVVPVHPDSGMDDVQDTSISTGVDRRIENPFRSDAE